jgi:hypothetical protein
MIILFPTSLYDSILPKEPSDPQNITYLISSEDPPRATQDLLQLPISEELKELPTRTFSKRDNRAVVGDFIFHVSSSGNSDIGSAKKQFEIGQLLDFDTETLPTVDPTEVPAVVNLQQNTNTLDLEGLGLSEEESDDLVMQAEDKFEELVNELNVIKEQISNDEVAIAENQKSLNETNKTLNAAQIVLDATGDTSTQGIIDKLAESKSALEAQRTSLVDNLNSSKARAKTAFDDLLRVRELVR